MFIALYLKCSFKCSSLFVLTFAFLLKYTVAVLFIPTVSLLLAEVLQNTHAMMLTCVKSLTQKTAQCSQILQCIPQVILPLDYNYHPFITFR